MIYYLSSTDSDLSGGADFNKALLTTASASSVAVSCLSGITEDHYGFTAASEPGSRGATGNYTVSLDLSAGNADFTVSAFVARINSSGVVQTGPTQVGTGVSGTAGIKTFGPTSVNLGTWSAGDRLRVTYRFANGAMATRNATVTLDADSSVDVPWSAAVSNKGNMMMVFI